MNKEQIKEKFMKIFNNIKNNISTISAGEYKFSSMLYIWGLLPSIIIIFFLQNSLNNIRSNFIAVLIYLILGIYFAWHIFSIRKTIKIHPEYRTVKPNKKELYKDKTKEEIEGIKKEKRKESVQKFLLLRAWDSTPNYVLVGCIDAYVILTQLQGILRIFRY